MSPAPPLLAAQAAAAPPAVAAWHRPLPWLVDAAATLAALAGLALAAACR